MRNCLLLLCCLFLTNARAQQWVQVDNPSQVSPDVSYIITYANEEGYYHTLYSEKWEYYGVWWFRSNKYSDKTYSSVASLAGKTTQFEVRQINGQRYLYSLADEKYVSNAESTSQAAQFLLKDEPDEACILNVVREDGVLCLKIGGRYFQHVDGSADYRLNTNRSKNCDIELWRQDDGTEPTVEEIDFNAGEDFHTDAFYGTVNFHRTFSSDYLNTLILPFAVSDCRMFASDIVVYKMSHVDKNTITFEPIEGYALEANTHYLVKGSFSKSDFTIKEVDIPDGVTEKEHTLKRGNITFHARYQAVSVGSTPSYILWKDNFYRCSEIASMTVSPSCWYLTGASSSAVIVRTAGNKTP